MQIDDNKFIQKKRTIQYFVQAAFEILENEGMEKITVRKVANKAGYNPATLYNYFENLDHLLFFMAMYNLNDYIDAIPVYLKHSKNSKDIYLNIWHCFIDYSFIKPEMFYNLFFSSSLKKNMNEYIKQYYAFFPLDIKNYPEDIRQMLGGADLSERSKQIMNKVIEDGFISKTDGYLLDDIIVLLYESVLMRVCRKSIDPGVGKDLLLQYIKTLFSKF